MHYPQIPHLLLVDIFQAHSVIFTDWCHENSPFMVYLHLLALLMLLALLPDLNTQMDKLYTRADSRFFLPVPAFVNIIPFLAIRKPLLSQTNLSTITRFRFRCIYYISIFLPPQPHHCLRSGRAS